MRWESHFRQISIKKYENMGFTLRLSLPFVKIFYDKIGLMGEMRE